MKPKEYKVGDLRNGFPVLAPKDRKKILMLSDDLRMTSGIGVMSKEIARGTVHMYDWVQIGAAIKHPDQGKIFDLSQELSKQIKIQKPYLKIYPCAGYGNPDLLREIIRMEKPDAIMHFTDPRQWVWLYQMEHEVRQQMPIFYYNIWDCPPAPLYNRDFYRSCDCIMNISKQTHALVDRVLQQNNGINLDVDDTRENIKYKKDATYISYVPHGIHEEEFKPLPDDDPDLLKMKKELFDDHDYKFVVYWNNRNIRRKMPGDLIIAFKRFVDQLPKKEKDEVLLLMHTAPIDQAGTNLIDLIDNIAPGYPILLDGKKWPPDQLNLLYNLSDITVNIASNEGFGLSSAESLMCGRMIINNITGGLQDQIRQEDKDGNWWTPTVEVPTNHHGAIKKWGEWALPVFPKTRSLVGSVPTPYILDDRCSWEDVSEQIITAYNMGRDERLRRGMEGRKWVTGDESMMSAGKMAEGVMKNVEAVISIWKPKERFRLFKDTEFTVNKPVDILETFNFSEDK